MGSARRMDWQATILPFGRLQPRSSAGPSLHVWTGLRATGNGARLENVAMKRIREMDAVVASVRRLLASGGDQLVHGDRLRKALQKYEDALKGGNARRLVRAASEISQIVCDEFLKK
jgi:hypothetical protein